MSYNNISYDRLFSNIIGRSKKQLNLLDNCLSISERSFRSALVIKQIELFSVIINLSKNLENNG